MCTKEEVLEVIESENAKQELRLLEKIHPMIEESVKAQSKHCATSPETRILIDGVKANCNSKTNNFYTNQKLMRRDLEQIQKDLSVFIKEDKEWKDNLRKDLRNDYVLKVAFKPIKRLVYGVLSLVLTAVVLALLALVIKS